MSRATTIASPKTAKETAMDKGGFATASISTLHPDIIQTHILSRLDCSTLASAAATCSQLNALVYQEDVWANLCRSTWPSTGSPGVHRVIQSFPNGSRSFFSDSYTIPRAITTTPGNSHMNLERTPQLIFAIDLYYREQPILSRVVETETVSEGFRRKPFRVDILEPKEAVSTPMKYTWDETARLAMVQQLRMSWIVIDAGGQRAVNLMNQSQIVFTRLTELEVRFQCKAEGAWRSGRVRFVVVERGEMQVSGGILEMEGKNGRESLVILQRALEGKRETKNQWSKRYQRELKRSEGREGWLDVVRGWCDDFLWAPHIIIFSLSFVTSMLCTSK
ncbi:hypothetical protein QN277_021225 [Acacia crassicarpa]|uniref:F-box domain-containing protein n=1 Tax=Acacia crassicarpa TaxID=499986 RepID=A0AAE1MSV8_9FABA|nr:hypothetical protein QN277_021225 [Acacia crassicarpa]